MKTIFNILVILVVAVLVGGLFYGAVSITSSGTNQTSFEERPLPGDFPASGEFNPPDREEFDGGVQFPVEMIKNLAVISVVAVVYTMVTKFFGRKKNSMPVSA